MKLRNAQETFEAAPKGRYKVKITAAETQISAKGSPMIKLTVEVREGDHAGKQAFDYLITDDSFKGAGMAKIKLRGLGVDVDVEQTDDQVCDQLLGREVMADLDVEQAQDKQKNLKWQTNPATGQQVPLMNNRVVAYHTAAVSAPTGTQPSVPPMNAPKVGGFPGFPGAVAPKAPEFAQPPFAGVQPPADEKQAKA